LLFHVQVYTALSYLQEPPKAAQLAFLKGAPAPPRRAHCVVQVPLPGAGYVYEVDVLLSSSPAQVVGWRKVCTQALQQRKFICCVSPPGEMHGPDRLSLPHAAWRGPVQGHRFGLANRCDCARMCLVPADKSGMPAWTQTLRWHLQCDGVQPMVTVDDCIEAEEIFKEDEGVQRALRERYGIHDPEEVACDPWYYGQRFSASHTQVSGIVSGGLDSRTRRSPPCDATATRAIVLAWPRIIAAASSSALRLPIVMLYDVSTHVSTTSLTSSAAMQSSPVSRRWRGASSSASCTRARRAWQRTTTTRTHWTWLSTWTSTAVRRD